MFQSKYLIFVQCAIILFSGILLISTQCSSVTQNRKPKSILTVLFIRNKQHTLPYFLTLFSNLNYPKERISLFIRSDHNEDESCKLIKEWVLANQNQYHSVDIRVQDGPPSKFPGETSLGNWTDQRFDHIISLKEEALLKARKMWADYIWYLDADAFITEPNTLWDLIEKQKPIIGPMLKSLKTYSNYWCGMTEHYWYKRTDDYLPILERKKIGCFSVPMIHSCVLIDLSLSASDNLTFDFQKITNYDGPKDDIITLALSAKTYQIEMFVSNEKQYGLIPPPLNENDEMKKEFQQLIDIKLEALVDFPNSVPLTASPDLDKYTIPDPVKNKLGFSNIYLINLVRRPDRRERMLKNFDIMGIEVEIFDAIDGKRMNATYLEDNKIKQLSKYKDPLSKRAMTYGEIGCFLSHYYIWEDIVKHQYEKVIVFEDDIHFEPFFIDQLNYLMDEMEDLDLQWDLVYLGRKKLQDNEEPAVEGSQVLVHVDYSYWTLCYILTLQGAQKLLAPDPLSKMVPVDEYIPIIFNKHPKTDWKEAFEPRTLSAFSSDPLLVHPTHYTGEEGYISDTEVSTIIEKEQLLEVATEPIGPPSLEHKGFTFGFGLNPLDKEEL